MNGYDAFLADLGHQPSAAECEQWAKEHAGDPDEPRALVDAGWHTARDDRPEEALALFRRATEFPGAAARDAQVGIVEQLYTLGRDDEADQAQRALRAELDDRPAASDLRIFDDMAEMLSDLDHPESALEWLDAGLALAGTDEPDDDAQRIRDSMRSNRAFLRHQLGHPEDDDDRAILAESDAKLAEVSELLDTLSRTESLRGRREHGEPFDGVVLWWDADTFAAVRARWPGSTTRYADNHDDYLWQIQREAAAYSDAGATHVRMVNGQLPDYESYAQRVGRDPGESTTRSDFGEWYARTHPERTLLWPPQRNEPCWCGSGRKYKKCHGSRARD